MAKIPCGIIFDGKKYTPEQFMAKLMDKSMDEYVLPKGKKSESGEYKTTTEKTVMPDGEQGIIATIEKPNGEKVVMEAMYPEDVEAAVAKKIRGFRLGESKINEPTINEQPLFEQTGEYIGKSVLFEHAGSEKSGKVIGVDTKGNLKVKDKNGVSYTVSQKNIIGEVSSTQKFYDEVAGAKPNTQTGRIPVEPIVGGNPKNLKDIIFDVSKKLKQRILYSKTSRNAYGTYSAGNTAVKIRFNGDLDTTAHELGHSIDDFFGILSDLIKVPNFAVEQELNKFSPFGSKPPKGHPDPRMYVYGEGFAEWLRAYIVNPQQAIKEAPNLHALYQSKVSPEYKQSISDFSTDIRTWAGSSGRDITLSNVELDPQQKGIMQSLLKPDVGNNEFVISWVDRLAAKFTQPLQAFNKAYEYAKNISGSGEPLPSDDPRILARLLLGIDGKYGEVLQYGMINGKNEVLTDKNGDAKNLDWLLRPLDNTDESTIKRDMEDVIAYMIAERTLELSNKFGKDNILTGIGGGIFKDVDIARKTIEEFNNGDPNRLNRIKEGANRYREFSDDILKYMVDKGRLSKEQYNNIKKDNLQYVALQRVIESEAGREIEVISKSSGALGSKTEVVKKIKGSTKEIKNPYISLIDTLHKALKESDRNDVLKSFRDALVENRQMYQGKPKSFADIGVLGKEGDKNSVTIFVDGKAEHWIFQEDVYNAIKKLDSEQYKLPILLTAFPKLLRWTVINFPIFAARNVIRDTQDRIIKSTDGSGFKELIGDAQHWRDLARAGGLNSGYYLKDKVAYNGLLKDAMQRIAENKNTILVDPSLLKKGWETYTNILQKGETLNRVAEYRAAFKNAKERGLDDYNASIEAAYKSRDLMDFALMGTYMNVINQIVPFSNAGIQGLRKTVSSAKANPIGFAGKVAVVTVLPDIVLWLLNHRDKDTAEEYESLPSYQRDYSWNFKIGPDMWLSIPRPYEVSLFSSAIDRGLSKFAYGNNDAYNGFGGSIANTVLPIDESNLTPFPGIVEGITNYDFFRNKYIVPPYQEKLDLSLRNTKRASRMGKTLQNIVGVDARKIDHFIKSQGSYFGGAMLKASNIGADDGDKFGLSDLGFFKDTPAYNSPQVQEFLKYAEKWGLGQSRAVKDINELAQDYFNEKNSVKKEQKAKILRDFAKIQLEEWKASNIQEQKQIKAKQKYGSD